MTGDYDSPWKEARDGFFEPFLALLFPSVHAQIDWSRGHESLDKEFQQVVREAERIVARKKNPDCPEWSSKDRVTPFSHNLHVRNLKSFAVH